MPTLDEMHVDEMTFRILDLPPEIRNMIYFQAAHGERNVRVKQGGEQVLRGWLTQSCRLNLLLSSRRLKEEYEAEVYRKATFTIDHGYVPQLQELNGNQYDFLRNLRHLVIHDLRETIDDFEDLGLRAGVVHGESEMHFENLMSLRTLHHIVECDIDGFEYSFGRKHFKHDNLFPRVHPKLVAGSGGCHTAVITRDVLLYSNLFSVNEEVARNDKHCDRLNERYHDFLMRRYSINGVTYRVTPSGGPYGWLGMDLETFRAKNVDLDGAYAFFWTELDEAKAYEDYLLEEAKKVVGGALLNTPFELLEDMGLDEEATLGFLDGALIGSGVDSDGENSEDDDQDDDEKAYKDDWASVDGGAVLDEEKTESADQAGGKLLDGNEDEDEDADEDGWMPPNKLYVQLFGWEVSSPGDFTKMNTTIALDVATAALW